MTTIDLLVGGDLGKWVLNEISPATVARVIASDAALADMAKALRFHATAGNVNELEPAGSVGFSVHYPFILRPATLSRYQVVYNLHPGFLPWGRGFYPIFWALWENTPAGATLHEMSERVDEGPIVDQLEVAHGPEDTGATLFERVRNVERQLFRTYWPRIVAGDRPACRPQPPGGSCHNRKEFLALKENAAWESMPGRDLVRLARCLTFPGYPGLVVKQGQRRFELVVQALDD